MTFSFYDFSYYGQWLGSFVILVLAINYYKHLERGLRIIGLMGLVSVLFQLFQKISQSFFESRYVNTIGDCYVYLETLLFFGFYYLLFADSRVLRLTLLWCGFVSTCIYFLVLIGEATYPWYSILRSTRDILLIFFSIVAFFKLITDLPNDNLVSLPVFWINSGILFFFSCTFMLSLTMDYIAQVLLDDFHIFWAFKNFLRAGFCVVICIGIWKARKLPIRSNGKSATLH